MSEPIIRRAKPGDEKAIHEAHMRSIREVCVKNTAKTRFEVGEIDLLASVG